jgi:hypothetical protein
MISSRLQVYGQRPMWMKAFCPVCDTLKETVFFKVDGEMVCRFHPGHPLYLEGEGQESTTRRSGPETPGPRARG